jgi:hypothetical protein
MQNTPVYLLNNRTEIIMNESGFITEYRQVYQRQLQVYKGIENTLQFRLLNADQKAQDVSALTPYFIAYDESKTTVIEKIGTILQTSDSTVFKNKGLVEVKISASDIETLDNQYLTYSIYFKNANNDDVLTYTNAHFGGTNIIKLSDAIYPDPQEPKSVTTFTANIEFGEPTSEWLSEAVYADPERNANSALHTAAIYTNTYAGNVKIQGTLENQITQGTQWADITTVTLDGTESTPTTVNFNGVFSYLRFSTDADPSTIKKILIKN